MEFQRENKYIVIKTKDAIKLRPSQQSMLSKLCSDLVQIRADRGKGDLECVVVESTWPEYEKVWSMIEARITGQQLVEQTSSEPIGYISANHEEQLEGFAETTLRAFDRGNDIRVYLKPQSVEVLVEAISALKKGGISQEQFEKVRGFNEGIDAAVKVLKDSKS